LARLSYGELAAAMQEPGGLNTYNIKEAYGRFNGFLYDGLYFTVIQSGTIAAVAVAFAKFTGDFFPIISADTHILQTWNLLQLKFPTDISDYAYKFFSVYIISKT
jgi:APA family basic amino acid/polyamine antiporter